MRIHDHGGEGCCEHDHGTEQPAPQNIALNPDAKGDRETTLRVTGMDCADEVEAVQQVLRPIKGCVTKDAGHPTESLCNDS